MSHPLQNLGPDDIVLESLPDEVHASMETRDRWMASLPYADGGLEYLVADLQAWTPGQVVRVAFLGGTPALYKDIEDACSEIMSSCNIILDFKDGGAYRTWSTNDTAYAAEIRVSFDQGGYFSLVGNDSTNSRIGMPGAAVGGGPNQRSLNLGGYHVKKPQGWQGTVKHEFLHALAFHHEHQNMLGPCQAAFRWEDDVGYQPTQDARGAYVADGNGLQPGIYTYLAGFPNGWSKAKVDHNLRASSNASLSAGPFDRASVMLYRFPPHFYKTHPSPCAPSGTGQELSVGDKHGLNVLYPRAVSDLNESATRREKLVKVIEKSAAQPDADGGLESLPLESIPTPHADLRSDAIARLKASLKQLRP